MKRRWLIFVLAITFLLTACDLAPAATPTAVPISASATPTQPAPSSTPTAVPETAVPTARQPSIQVDNPGAALADLDPGWTKIEPGGETRCALDTPYAYWVRPGSSGRLLLFLEGGGGCWDAETCRANSTFYDDDVGPDDNPTLRGGLFDLDNPDNPFRDDTIVFMPSCTGDVHWGDQVQTYPQADDEDLTVYHRGFVNAAAALAWAYTNVPQPESVFITGCSAGSVGSRVHAPYVIEQYPQTPVTQLGDSLAFVFGRPVNIDALYGTYGTFPDWIPALAPLKEGPLLMVDYDTAVANHYPDHIFAQYNTESDSVQERFYVANGGEPGGLAADLADHLSAIHAAAPNFRSYTADGSLHCILPRPEFYTRQVNGVPLVDWVRDLAAGRDVPNVQCETCGVETAE